VLGGCSIFPVTANNDGGPVISARDAALARRITVSGVAIMFPGHTRPQEDIDRLDDYFADCVIGGAGSFVLPANSSADLKEAIRTTLVSEVTGRVPERAQTSSAEREKRVSCRKGEEVFERVWTMPPGKRPPEPRFATAVVGGDASKPGSQASVGIAEAIAANFKKCVRPARTGPTSLVSLDYKPDGTYRGKPLLIHPQDNEEYSRAAAWVTKQINKCPPVKFSNGTSPQTAIRWEFPSEESAKSSRR
jgi:hypothetical protein